MRETRSPDERRTDAALLLALWSRAADKPREDAGDKLRQMKLAYLTAQRLREQSMRALNLSFFRWTWGPMSNEVYDAWELLERGGLVNSEEHFVFTRQGASLAEEFYEDVLRDERNAPIREVFDEVANKWRQNGDTAPLMKFVYSMEVSTPEFADRIRIHDIPKGMDMLEPIDEREARGLLYVDRGWLETLALTLRPGADAQLRDAVDDFRSGRVHVA